MKNSFLFGVAVLIAVGVIADPVIENVSIEQDALTHRVAVSYDLTGEDGIVTVCFLTNGAPFEASKHVVGDVSKVVAVGNGKKIYWQPNLDLGETNLLQYAISARVTAWSKSSPPAYYVLNLETGGKRFYEYEGQLPLGIDSDVYRTTQMVFRHIYAAGQTFTMGAPQAEQQAFFNVYGYTPGFCGCETQHKVSFTADYYIGVFEVTQAQWRKVFGSIPDSNQQQNWEMTQSYTNEKETLPIHHCTRNRWIGGESHAAKPWEDDVSDSNHPTFLTKFRNLAGSGTLYHLPFEAQWEYACRAGTTTAFNDGRDFNVNTDYSDIAVYNTTQPARVGSKKPNAWGLYDMHGNVEEVVRDQTQQRSNTTDEAKAYYAQDAVDPKGITDGTATDVAYRGGHWGSGPHQIRSAYRINNRWWGQPVTQAGFRIACPIDRY